MRSIVVDRKPEKISMLALVVCALMASTVSAAGNPSAPPFLYGQRLGLYAGDDKYIIANQPFYVLHGFGTDVIWKEVSLADKKLLLGSYLELYIDGVQVNLRPWLHFPDGFMFKQWYIQFEPYAFAAGSTHEFHMIWYYDGSVNRDVTTKVYFT